MFRCPLYFCQFDPECPPKLLCFLLFYFLFSYRKHALNCHRMKPALFNVLCEIKEKTGRNETPAFGCFFFGSSNPCTSSPPALLGSSRCRTRVWPRRTFLLSPEGSIWARWFQAVGFLSIWPQLFLKLGLRQRLWREIYRMICLWGKVGKLKSPSPEGIYSHLELLIIISKS